MASVSAIRAGLATRLATVISNPALTVIAYQPDSVAVPTATVAPESITFDRTYGRAVDEFEFVVRIYAARADDRGGQEQLDSFLTGSGAGSIKAAIEADITLGGIAQTLHVTGVRNYGAYEVSGIAYYGAEFAVTVWAAGA